MPRQQRTVLVVDDNPRIRQFLCVAFESAGFRVCALDLAMPVMNGLQAAPALRQALPGVPIILFSLYADSIQTKDAMAAGVVSRFFRTFVEDGLVPVIATARS